MAMTKARQRELNADETRALRKVAIIVRQIETETRKLLRARMNIEALTSELASTYGDAFMAQDEIDDALKHLGRARDELSQHI